MSPMRFPSQQALSKLDEKLTRQQKDLNQSQKFSSSENLRVDKNVAKLDISQQGKN